MKQMIDILKASEWQPRYHGNGFVQLYVTKEHRLHIWTPTLPKFRDHNADIHNHRYNAYSEVLVGCLKHVTYAVEPAEFGQDMLWEVRSPDGALHSMQRVRVRLTGEYHLAAGSRYLFNQPEFHTSDIMPKRPLVTVTLFHIGEKAFEHPQVVAPYGREPTNAFEPSLAPPVEELWRVIENVLQVYPVVDDRLRVLLGCEAHRPMHYVV